MRRRDFVTGLTLATTVGVGAWPALADAEPPPETTRLRLLRTPSLCEAPAQVARALLGGEGFVDVDYVRVANSVEADRGLAAGTVDMGLTTAYASILRIDAGDPRVLLAGIHPGCFELFGTERIRTIKDLKGKTVAVPALGSSQHALIVAMAAYVGLKPGTDIHWVVRRGAEAMELLAEAKIDAFVGFPPEPQRLRARKIGHVVVDTAKDRPWSEHFCCVVSANREFVRKHPAATKRALRALLKATTLCADNPGETARLMVERGYADDLDLVTQTMKEMPYARWRELDAENTVRFYALRLREAGMIKGNPQQILARGTDWRFLNELKKELKG